MKIFNVYWSMGKDEARIPPAWPMEYSTKFNYTTPLKVSFNDNEFSSNAYFSVSIGKFKIKILSNIKFEFYFQSSPPQMSPIGRAQDIDAILHVIRNAEKFIHISVMDYLPLTMYTPKIR